LAAAALSTVVIPGEHLSMGVSWIVVRLLAREEEVCVVGEEFGLAEEMGLLLVVAVETGLLGLMELEFELGMTGEFGLVMSLGMEYNDVLPVELDVLPALSETLLVLLESELELLAGVITSAGLLPFPDDDDAGGVTGWNVFLSEDLFLLGVR